jgi:hypothetical protein
MLWFVGVLGACAMYHQGGEALAWTLFVSGTFLQLLQMANADKKPKTR